MVSGYKNKIAGALAMMLMTAVSAFGQVDIQLRARQMPGWDPRAREGRCDIHVWVDHRAEVRMRGDSIFVRTLEGAKARDEGSQCSQPLPYNSVSNFQVRQSDGRSGVKLAQEPSRMNNFTAVVVIEDEKGGGDDYTFQVMWRSEGNAAEAPAPFFDEVRACQDVVRQRFVSQNGRGAYLDFDSFAGREVAGRGAAGRGGAGPRRNQQNETIQGKGSARSRNETRDLTYSCLVDVRRGQIISGTYQYSGGGYRTNENTRLR